MYSVSALVSAIVLPLVIIGISNLYLYRINPSAHSHHQKSSRLTLAIVLGCVIVFIGVFIALNIINNNRSDDVQEANFAYSEPIINDETEVAPIEVSEREYESSVEYDYETINLLVYDMLAQLERQTQIDEMLLAELNSGIHTFDDPFVILNPYGMSPLTALALFSSSEPMNISIYVHGRNEHTGVYFTFDGFNTKHEIPILGLYPNKLNTVILTGRTFDEEERTVILEIQTNPLPRRLAGDIFHTNLLQPENYQVGFNFTWDKKTAFDVNGEYRWFYNDFRLSQVALHDYNGHMIFKISEHEPRLGPPQRVIGEDTLIFEVNKLGRIFNVWHTPYGHCHDLADIYGGNLILLGHYGEATEDFIYELDINTGEVVNRLDLKRILQRTRAVVPNFNPLNWFHHNSVEYRDGSIIISGRFQHAVVKLSWPEGEIEWILSDHTGWHPMFHQYLLTPVGDGFEWFYGQHTPVFLPDSDDNPDTIDIMLLDNGFGRFYTDRELQRAIALNEAIEPENFSRMVHYRINTRERTVEQIWEWGREWGSLLFAESRSSVQFLENGNRLGVFDITTHGIHTTVSTLFFEVDILGNTVWEALATEVSDRGVFRSYRGARLPLYTAAANYIRIGQATGVFIPDHLLP